MPYPRRSGRAIKYPFASNQFDAEANVGRDIVGRSDALTGEPWFTIANGNGPPPDGRKTRTRKTAPFALIISVTSCSAVSTVSVAAPNVGHTPKPSIDARTTTDALKEALRIQDGVIDVHMGNGADKVPSFNCENPL
jgi:hypothetical protein